MWEALQEIMPNADWADQLRMYMIQRLPAGLFLCSGELQVIEDVLTEDVLKIVRSKMDEMVSNEQAARDREQALQEKLKETEADRDHLKNQMAKAKDFSKLLENTLTQGEPFFHHIFVLQQLTNDNFCLVQDEMHVLRGKLEKTEEDRDHLKNQVTKSEDDSKLLENKLAQGEALVLK